MKYAFISGFYKSGTSWLLNVLAHHPNVLGLREHDVIFKIKSAWPDRKRIIQQFFEEPSWGRTDPEQQYRSAGLDPASYQRPNHSADLPQDRIDALLRAMFTAPDPAEMARVFLDGVQVYDEEVHYILTKGAAQVRDIDTIFSWFPDAKVMLIVRDGRDAMISAKYFREYRNLPVDFEALVTQWHDMMQKYLEVRDRFPLHVMTYERLKSNFTSSVAGALEYLQLPYDWQLIERINNETSFQRMTGRAAGVEKPGIIRKGIVGDWREKMTSDEKAIFKRIGGQILMDLGYADDLDW